MDDPIKVIWKFKNNNRRTQYHIYIFIGALSSDVIKPLNKIKDLNLYDSLIHLSDSEYKKLEKKYGSKWYEKFFNTYHINFTIDQIRESKSMKKELTTKFGEKWFNDHINSYLVSGKKLIYSYAALIKDERDRKSVKKGRSTAIIADDDADLDYKMNKTVDLKSYLGKKMRRQARPNEDVDSLSTDSMSSLDSATDSTSDVDHVMRTPSRGVTVEGNFLRREMNSDVPEVTPLKKKRHRKGRRGEKNIKSNVDDMLVIDSADLSSGYEMDLTDSPDDAMYGGADDDHTPDNYEIYPLGMYDTIDNDRLDDPRSSNQISRHLQIGGQMGGETAENEADAVNVDDYFENGMDSDDVLDEEESDIDEIEKIYKDLGNNIDDDASKTTNLIKQALDDNKLFDKRKKKMLDFDPDKDNNVYDETLKDTYRKFYVQTQYIYKDDTIKSIKNKVCCSLKNSKKFGSHPYVLPSRQYMWCEYIFENKINKVMLGQKWLRRNELLDIDVEPSNNLRYYEDLPGKLKLLRDNIRRYGNKIRMENDENYILYDYEDYMNTNELFMIDIYNELGKDYSADNDAFKNLLDVYVKLYYPRIRADDLKSCIEYLKGNPRSEVNKITKVYDSTNNDLIMEDEIMNVVETVKIKDDYGYIFKDNYITQSVIHLNLRLLNDTKIDLFRIFNEFNADETYPFIQYQTAEDGVIKFYEKDIYGLTKNKDNIEVLYKWFENTPYGISFKVKIQDKNGYKYMGIGLSESGRIEYKTQWKEEDMATIDDIRKTHEYVKNLIKKINSHKNKVEIDIPDDSEFKFAFINTIQKFELPNKFHINHNHLSNFSRFFYPYIALVIDPRKRQAKIKKDNDTSKFGTYIRYKRVSKYENQARLEQRIIYFIRNYEYTDVSLANEISKQFNITEEKALEDIERVKQRFPNLKKSRKVLKKLENIPKYKPPGIGIDVQGKQRDKYKIRISGARDKNQLDRIINFMNILIYLYTETYLYKRPDRQVLKEKLKKLTNIAKRRSKVEDVVNYAKEIKSVKQMTQLDKRRLGFKPEKGQNQWTRACQNSGTDKKRRPQQYNNNTIDKLLKKGYTYNKKKDSYEKKVKVKNKKGKKIEVTLNTIKLPEYNEDGTFTGNYIYYACDPEENGEHMYIGFLTRSSNPYGHCMPCCFIINPATSKNKSKRDFFNKCLGQSVEDDKDDKSKSSKVVGDLLYILQDTNKIQEGRLGFLPKYLDLYFNRMLNKDKKIKHHYLAKTESGYYFKFGSKQDEYQFLNSIVSTLDMSIKEIKDSMLKALDKDRNEHIFTSLNNGDIKTQFGTREKYMEYIKNSNYLEFSLVNTLLCVPGVLVSGGLNIVVFRKQNVIIAKTLEKEKIREDFYLDCQDVEDYNNLIDPSRKTIILMRENKNYYPIVMVTKPNEDAKSVKLDKTFSYGTEKHNIINHIKDFYERNCHGTFIDKVLKTDVSMPAKFTRSVLMRLDKKYHPRYQIVDVRNKCKYIITYEGYIIPLKQSGSLFDIQILKHYGKYVLDMKTTVKYLKDIYEKSNKALPIKPIGVYYDTMRKGKITVNAIMTKSRDVVPVTPITLDSLSVEKEGLLMERKPLTDKIDEEISKGKDNFVVDKRILEVKKDEFTKESYELFRLEFSNYINRDHNSFIKGRVERTINNKKLTYKEKIVKLRLIIFKLIDSDLYNKYNKIAEKAQRGGKAEKLVHVASTIPDLLKYEIRNDREICAVHENKDQCNMDTHCHWTHSGCYLSLTRNMIIEFVNKISEELARNNLKAFEILQVGNYFVSDIVDHNRFTERDGQKILKSSSSNIKKALSSLFGQDNIPKIGKRKMGKQSEVSTQALNLDNPAQEFNDMFVQKIINNNLTIFRAYVNGYYWLRHKMSDAESRNLGYYNSVQTDLANYFRGLIVDWLKDSNNRDEIKKNLMKYMEVKKSSKIPINDFIIKLTRDINVTTNCFVELYVFSKINKDISIIVVDDENKPIYYFSDGLEYNRYLNGKVPANVQTNIEKNRVNSINIRFDNPSQYRSPDSIEVLYYK